MALLESKFENRLSFAEERRFFLHNRVGKVWNQIGPRPFVFALKQLSPKGQHQNGARSIDSWVTDDQTALLGEPFGLSFFLSVVIPMLHFKLEDNHLCCPRSNCSALNMGTDIQMDRQTLPSALSPYYAKATRPITLKTSPTLLTILLECVIYILAYTSKGCTILSWLIQ